MVDYDVGIIGGGPAGASMAAYLAQAGVRCIVFEAELFPRPHVGESLVPSSTRVFDELGFLPMMEAAKFPHKYGAAWTAAANAQVYSHDWQAQETSVDVRFDERAQAGVAQEYTYHVDRGRFDQLLLEHAESLGATVCQGVQVDGVDLADRGHTTIRHRIGGRDSASEVCIAVDASGRKTLIGRQMNWRVRDPVFDQYALHCWFEGYDRSVLASKHEQQDYIFVHFLPLTNSWVWQIPITETTTSIGVVTQRKHFAKKRASRTQFFWDCIGTRPELLEALRAATQLHPLKEEGDYSYSMKQLAADTVVLVGDAGRFVDPIFSTGVSIALNSSRFASRDVLAALEHGDFTRKAFETYETTLRRGTRNWYRFISVYYRLNVLFTAFVYNPRYRLDILKLLQGDVYDEDEPPVLERMREIVRSVEQNPDHLWHNMLGELTAGEFVSLSET